MIINQILMLAFGIEYWKTVDLMPGGESQGNCLFSFLSYLPSGTII